MQLLNPEKALKYMDALRGERGRSAVLAIHLTWLEYSSPQAVGKRIESTTPLDLLLLYEAVAATFQDGKELAPCAKLPSGGRVVNRRQAAARLSAVEDEETRNLASSFLCHVIGLSDAVVSEQDLDCHLALFLQCIKDKKVIDNIRSGAVARESERLSDPDFW